MRRPPPRIYAQKRIDDIRQTKSLAIAAPIESMNSVELVDTLAVYACRVSTPPLKEGALVESPREALSSILGRAQELLPHLDPVLVVRIFSYLQSVSHISTSEYQELLNACVSRLADLSIQQLVRLMFTVSVARRRLALDTVSFTESCFSHMNLEALGATTPPRLVAKLVVSSAMLATPTQTELVLPKLEHLVLSTITNVQPDQVQQVAFGLGRLGTKNTDLVNRITMHALDITPIQDQKTYSSLLISLHRLNPPSPAWEAFKKIYCDHIGLGPSEPPHVSNIAECLPRESEILVRRIRNALVH